jgi:hypothetical protein
MTVMRIALLIANGVWLPDFGYQGAWRLQYFATYPTTHDLIFFSALLAMVIPIVTGSLTLAGNIAYMGLFPPHAQNEIGASASRIMRTMRIVLLITNGFWLSIYAVGAPFSVYVLAKHDDYPVVEAIATHVVCFSSWPATSPTSGALGGTRMMKRWPAHRTRQPLMGSAA